MPSFTNIYYQLLTLVFLLNFLSGSLHKIKTTKPLVNIFLLFGISLPIMIVLYEDKNWWALGYCGLILMIGVGYYAMKLSYRSLKPIHIILLGLFSVGLGGDYFLKLIKLYPKPTIEFYYYMAVVIIYFYKETRTISYKSSPRHVNFAIKPFIAISLVSISITILSAQFLGFFDDINRLQVKNTWEVFNFIFLTAVSIEAIVKIGFYKIATFLWSSIYVIDIFISTTLTGFLHWSITDNIHYLTLGTVVGFFTAIINMLGGFWAAVTIRLIISLIAFFFLGIAI